MATKTKMTQAEAVQIRNDERVLGCARRHSGPYKTTDEQNAGNDQHWTTLVAALQWAQAVSVETLGDMDVVRTSDATVVATFRNGEEI